MEEGQRREGLDVGRSLYGEEEPLRRNRVPRAACGVGNARVPANTANKLLFGPQKEMIVKTRCGVGGHIC